MADTPDFDEVLRLALEGLHSEDVRIFYDYFEELKSQSRKYLGGKAKVVPGLSAVAHSALVSMFCDLALQNIPLSDTDEYGCPMLWPLLLKYVERHCNKWKAYHRTKKRKAAESSKIQNLPDHRAAAGTESEFANACAVLYKRLSPEEQAVVELRLEGKTLEQIATHIGRTASTVSNRLHHIRSVLKQG